LPQNVLQFGWQLSLWSKSFPFGRIQKDADGIKIDWQPAPAGKTNMSLIPPHRLARRTLLKAVPAALLTAAGGRLLNGCETAIGYAANDNEEADASFTPESEKSVARALDWLAKTQNNDGGCGVDVGQVSDIGTTAMVGLALLANGTTPIDGSGNGMLRRLQRFLMTQTENMPSNDITGKTGTQLQNKIGRHAHSFFAALFFSQVIGQGDNPDPVRRSLKRVVSAIVHAQDSRGSWGSQSWAPVLGTVMGWVSLRASHSAGLTVGAAPQKTAGHLIEQMKNNLNSNQGWMHTLYKNATGIRVLYEMEQEHHAIADRAFKDVLQLITRDNTPFTQAGGEEFLAFHLITETMLKKGGSDWNAWFPVVRDKLIGVQNGDGSWTGHHCITSRTFCTAASVLVLTSPYRFLPVSQA
jgi:hypothetical protein